MTFEVLANTIRARFAEQVATPNSLLVAYDNVMFDPPQGSTWVRFTVLPADSRQVSLHQFRTPGVAVAQIFVPIHAGDKNALVLADKVKTAFRAKSLVGVTFRTPSLRRVGRTDNWYQLNVSCPFYSDDVEGV